MATQEISRPITHRNPYAEPSQKIEHFSWDDWEELLCEAALQVLEED